MKRVPARSAEKDLMVAVSIGAYFDETIKGQFACKKLTD